MIRCGSFPSAISGNPGGSVHPACVSCKCGNFIVAANSRLRLLFRRSACEVAFDERTPYLRAAASEEQQMPVRAKGADLLKFGPTAVFRIGAIHRPGDYRRKIAVILGIY